MVLPLLPLAGGLLGMVAARRSRPHAAAIIGAMAMALTAAAAVLVVVRLAGPLAAADVVAFGIDAGWGPASGAFSWRLGAGPVSVAVMAATVIVALVFHLADLPTRWGVVPRRAAMAHASVDLLGGGLLWMAVSASAPAMIAGGQVVAVAVYLLVGRYLVSTRAGAALSSAATDVAGAAWRRVDLGLIEGTVDGVAGVVGGWSRILRRVQTGSVRVYAASSLAGIVLIFGFYLWSR